MRAFIRTLAPLIAAARSSRLGAIANPVVLVVTLMAAVVLAAAGEQTPKPAEYDPLAVPNEAGQTPAAYIDLSMTDSARNRTLPLRVYIPAAKAPAPVVLFSHGLGGTRATCAYLGEHWAARGYVAVFVQHPGSDDSVWKDLPPGQRMAAMRDAASLQNLLLRVHDIPAVLTQLEVWNRTADHLLHGRLDMAHVGMSGHSFGALTTQALSGQSMGGRGQIFTDRRIKAALILSPSGPRGGGDPSAAFGSVRIPWMLMTGTLDVGPFGDTDVTSRLSVYPALPPGDKYELVLFNAEHSAFTESALPGDTVPRNKNHHRVVMALSTAFWDAYLRKDAQALAWLKGDGPRALLETKDRWQRK